MATHPIQWHEECLKNMTSYHVREKEDFERWLKIKKEELFKLELDIATTTEQIKEAKRKKMDGFDRDRFLKHRRIEK